MQNCKHETKQNKSRFLSNDRWAWYGRDVPTNVASNIIPGLQTDLILLTESLCGVFLLHLTVIIDPAGLLRTQTYTCDMIEACSVVKKCDLSLTLWRRSDQRYCSLIRFPSAIWQSVVGGMALRRATGNRGGNPRQKGLSLCRQRHRHRRNTSFPVIDWTGHFRCVYAIVYGVMEWGGVVGQCVHVTVHCQCIPEACAVHVTWPEQLNAHAQSGLLSRCSPVHWPIDHYTTPQTIVLSRGVSVKIVATTVISRPPTTLRRTVAMLYIFVLGFY